jgi:hypothetical protein
MPPSGLVAVATRSLVSCKCAAFMDSGRIGETNQECRGRSLTDWETSSERMFHETKSSLEDLFRVGSSWLAVGVRARAEIPVLS